MVVVQNESRLVFRIRGDRFAAPGAGSSGLTPGYRSAPARIMLRQCRSKTGLVTVVRILTETGR